MNLNTAALQNTAFACGTSFTIPSNAYETSIINNSVVDLKVIYLDTDEQNRTESPYLFPEKTSGQNSPRRHRFRSAHSSHGKKHAEKAHWSSTDTGTNILSNPHDSIDHALNLHGIQSIHRSSIGRVKVNPIQSIKFSELKSPPDQLMDNSLQISDLIFQPNLASGSITISKQRVEQESSRKTSDPTPETLVAQLHQMQSQLLYDGLNTPSHSIINSNIGSNEQFCPQIDHFREIRTKQLKLTQPASLIVNEFERLQQQFQAKQVNQAFQNQDNPDIGQNMNQSMNEIIGQQQIKQIEEYQMKKEEQFGQQETKEQRNRLTKREEEEVQVNNQSQDMIDIFRDIDEDQNQYSQQ